jgi:hypothetical protein
MLACRVKFVLQRQELYFVVQVGCVSCFRLVGASALACTGGREILYREFERGGLSTFYFYHSRRESLKSLI